MGIYRYLCEVGGGNKPFVARAGLSENVDVEKGDILYYIENEHTVTPKSGVSGLVAGVCAKNYRAEKNELIPGGGNMEVELIISPDALYRIPACVITESNGNSKTLVCTDAELLEFSNTDGYVGSRLVLAEKGENSGNTSATGTEYTITEVTSYDGYFAFATDKPSDSCKGDKYVFIPKFGFDRFFFDEDNRLAIGFANEDGAAAAVDADRDGVTVKLKNAGIFG